MSWEFKPGMRVVCVNDDFGADAPAVSTRLGITLPTKGTVYTLREVVKCGCCTHLNVRLAEIRNPIIRMLDGGQDEPAFGDFRFRPLDESRLDVFRNLLVDLPKEEELA